MINIIVAISDNYAIGRDGDMPWHISADLKYFKSVTLNHTVIMGRRTWESIGCRPLKDRVNIVVSRTMDPQEGIWVAPSLEEALEMSAASEEIFIMGGGRLYADAMKYAQRLYITHVHTMVEDADTFFPLIEPSLWRRSSLSETHIDERSNLRFEFAVYDRTEE